MTLERGATLRGLMSKTLIIAEKAWVEFPSPMLRNSWNMWRW